MIAGLSPAQRRSLEVTLRAVERAVDEVLFWMDRTPVQGETYELVCSWGPAERAQVREQAAAIREQVRALRERWGLRRERIALETTLRSETAVLWADLEDCRPEKLRRYGEVSPQLQEVLAPEVERLIRLVQGFGRVSSGSP